MGWRPYYVEIQWDIYYFTLHSAQNLSVGPNNMSDLTSVGSGTELNLEP
jgi:hypothetical protein